LALILSVQVPLAGAADAAPATTPSAAAKPAAPASRDELAVKGKSVRPDGVVGDIKPELTRQVVRNAAGASPLVYQPTTLAPRAG